MKIKLKKTGKEHIKKASQQSIVDYFVSLPPHERKIKWLRKNNRYRIKCDGQYTSDIENNCVDDRKLAEYIAASGPAHAIDGWSFIGRAVESLFRRDAYSAIHFGYYGELRAAMALLACEGIGILNDKHPIVQVGNSVVTLPKVSMRDHRGQWSNRWARTHVIVVPCLQYWSSLQRAADLLDEIVQPANLQLSVWLNAFGVHARTRAVAKAWLQSWGLDLAQIDSDHDARNLVSYRPSEFRLPSPPSVTALTKFIRDLWTLFEPAPNVRFLNLERYLLRRALQKSGATTPSQRQIEGLGFTERDAIEWMNFLSDTTDPLPLNDAENSSSIESTRCPLQVISRAVLLLYIATAAAGKLLSNAGYNRETLNFWWQRFGIHRGLWDDVSVPSDPRDAWADIELALQDIELANSGFASGELNGWRRKVGGVLGNIGAWELVAIWGLVP